MQPNAKPMVVVVCVVGILIRMESLNLSGVEMNALELADVLEGMTTGWFVNDWKLLSDSATMLRQQQAEIEALRMMLANRNDALDKLDLK